MAESQQFQALRDQGRTINEAMAQSFTGFEGAADFTTELALLLGTSETSSIPLSQLIDASQGWRKRRLENIELRNTLLSPRLAVAWDPWGTGKTKLAVTAGRYYDKIFLSVPLLAAEAPIRGAVRGRADGPGLAGVAGANGGPQRARDGGGPRAAHALPGRADGVRRARAWPESSAKVTWCAAASGTSSRTWTSTGRRRLRPVPRPTALDPRTLIPARGRER